MAHQMTDRKQEVLARLRGDAPLRTPTVRVLARFGTTADCQLAALGFAAGVDFDHLLVGTEFESPFGQSPFTLARGHQFENSLRRDGYGPLLALLRSELGFELRDARVANLRDAYPRNRVGLRMRAHETRSLLRRITRGERTAPNVIDGAVLEAQIASVRAHFEADALAARGSGPIHIGEVKSFPVVDGRADEAKVGQALDQAATYALLARQAAVELGANEELISGDALLINPRNVGMRPQLVRQNIESRVRRIDRLFSQLPDAAALARELHPLPGFGSVADRGAPERRRLAHLEQLAEATGTCFRPNTCLSSCGLARFCRARHIAVGAPVVAGAEVVRLLPQITSLPRALELAAGAPPRSGEGPAAAQVARAARLLANVRRGQP